MSTQRRAGAESRPAESKPDAVDAAELAEYHGLARLIERMHRRFLDVVRAGLLRQGIDDIGPVQALMIMLIGDDEPSVRDLMERGYYLGSNASYSLKILVEAGYIDRGASQRDRRTARLRLTDKGRTLRDELFKLEQLQATALVRNEGEAADLKAAYRTLRRLDRIWGDMVRYAGQGLD
ncbi:MarR family winged helix-turn-helix transcriptional regulator [Roseomonas genomospecies 6]|uniref:MarR family transcriptional regulator n=1 Tax=Roseomonas genomospecies 6 TaxID=214106 RepID=A0A9W7TU25_9PROT|nr:MarR family winged helix-turn-helix transcriptional regulator [Roseomonas genomospecies 6]KAA0678563.1 MarR family transcriptional regulator [Roseomonas genomospecies 6]